MKRQIRRGVFETNSSSVHSLSITRNDKSHLIWDVLLGVSEHNNGVLKLGVTPIKDIAVIFGKSVVDFSKLQLQTTLDILYYNCFVDCEIMMETFGNVLKFISLFEKHGIKVEASINEITKAYPKFVWLFTDELNITELLEKSSSFEDGIEQLLASDYTVYTHYEDDCRISCPEEIEEVYDHFSKIPEDKKITATIRC